jgi:hypothetical protein
MTRLGKPLSDGQAVIAAGCTTACWPPAHQGPAHHFTPDIRSFLGRAHEGNWQCS